MLTPDSSPVIWRRKFTSWYSPHSLKKKDHFKNTNMLFEIIKIVINTLTQLPLENEETGGEGIGNVLEKMKKETLPKCSWGAACIRPTEGPLGTQGTWRKEGTLRIHTTNSQCSQKRRRVIDPLALCLTKLPEVSAMAAARHEILIMGTLQSMRLYEHQQKQQTHAGHRFCC